MANADSHPLRLLPGSTGSWVVWFISFPPELVAVLLHIIPPKSVSERIALTGPALVRSQSSIRLQEIAESEQFG
jgi:hypothetical protein